MDSVVGARGGRGASTPLSTRATAIQSIDIAHLIQVALTPIFLISAIGVTLNVLTNRLARIVDRARAIEDRARAALQPADRKEFHHSLAVLERRARWINAAITLITLSALFIVGWAAAVSPSLPATWHPARRRGASWLQIRVLIFTFVGPPLISRS